MDRGDTQDGLGTGTNTQQNLSQIPDSLSLNNIHIDTEDAANVQDKNISGVFEYFLHQYFHTGPTELDEVDIDDDEDENIGDLTGAGESSRLPYYVRRIVKMLMREPIPNEVFPVHLDHVLNWRPYKQDAPSDLNVQLYRYLVKNFLRMQEPLENVLQNIVARVASNYNRAPRKFYLELLYTPSVIYPLREIKCNMLGELICVRGQVTRVSDVRPELVKATFKCKTCGTIINDIVQQFKYTTPTKCPSNNCLNSTDWELLMDRSSFCDWQKIRIQEVAQESESGSMPCSIEVILRNRLVDTLNAGDRVQISGSLIVVPDIPSMINSTQLGENAKKVMRQGAKRFESFLLSQGITGIKGVGAKQLNHRLSFLASQVLVVNQFRNNLQINELEDKFLRADDLLNITGFEWIKEISNSRDTIDRLSKIIAPNVWGNYEIKKGLLLLLVGGVHKSSRDAKLRGDINMCIVGDPSTAKSQFLKFVESFAPRAVYTSGKGSTAAGLTAAVFKDRDNNDYVLEAGALMYADEGICCIDEFDKMNERDRVSIHEAMEQQTISISKAGIQATLNARASVLAACNPKYGRYDTSKSFKENVNIPSPLLSRFDLLYTILDENNNQVNKQVSEYICNRYNKYTNESSPLVINPNNFNTNQNIMNTSGYSIDSSNNSYGFMNLSINLDSNNTNFPIIDETQRENINYYGLSKWDEYTNPKYIKSGKKYINSQNSNINKISQNQSSQLNNNNNNRRNDKEMTPSNNSTNNNNTQIDDNKEEMNLDELRLYIELCKRLKPLMQDSAKRKLSEYYIELRNGDIQTGRRSLRMTVRQLESLVRLSEAVAKLKFSDFVTSQHVQIAYEIFKASLLKLTNKSHIQLSFTKDITKLQLDTERTNIDTNRTQDIQDNFTSQGTFISNIFGYTNETQIESDMIIGVEEYNAISSVLLDRVGEYELSGNLIANNELVEWYLENVLIPRDEKEADEWNLKLQQMIYRLAFIDSKLIATQTENDPDNIYRLRVHPNYFSHTHMFSQKTEHISGLDLGSYDTKLIEEGIDLDDESLLELGDQFEDESQL